MSRPLKLKVTGTAYCRFSNSPTWGYKGSLRGRTADAIVYIDLHRDIGDPRGALP
jgi:hypothetical protein